jgi:RHS repeat-associated protein
MSRTTLTIHSVLVAAILCGLHSPSHAAGPRSFGQSNQQTGSLKVSRLDYDARDRAKQAGIAFDANDNTSKAANGTRYTYDAANRLIKSVSIDATPVIVEYFYDALGQLIRTKTNGISSDYVLDESGGLPKVIGEITGTTEQLYVYGPEGLHAQRKIENGVAQPVQYALNDGLGSVKGMVDSSGAIIGTQAYNSWGEIRYRGGAQPPSLGYTGEQNFADGTVHLRARSYLPSQGRFLQRDSFAGFAGNGQSQNRYTYAEGNPVNYSDPSGFSAIGPTNFPGLENPTDALCNINPVFCVKTLCASAAGKPSPSTPPSPAADKPPEKEDQVCKYAPFLPHCKKDEPADTAKKDACAEKGMEYYKGDLKVLTPGGGGVANIEGCVWPRDKKGNPVNLLVPPTKPIYPSELDKKTGRPLIPLFTRFAPAIPGEVWGTLGENDRVSGTNLQNSGTIWDGSSRSTPAGIYIRDSKTGKITIRRN